ncbi:putative pilus assembly protein FilE [Acinetobacter courvalinii]|uniref:putative pilus assembly protein FilE n=1 Tax=Acinetobacter courvalinii TaxID=280147 RepID=UPI0019009C71|nr:putative pilus assembly protein FilE [Acinetobacter courvalinii]MBJ8419449.1 putative pilus assembly protein FilE [Acinetobacter courvalinii]
MQKRRTRQTALVISLLCLMVTSASTVYADGFYTIIGPDGRPMVVPMKIGKKQAEPKQNIQTELAPSSQTIIKSNLPSSEQKKTVEVQPKLVEIKPTQSNTVKMAEPVRLSQVEPKVAEQLDIPSKITPPEPANTQKIPLRSVEKAKVHQKETPKNLDVQGPLVEPQTIAAEKVKSTSKTEDVSPKIVSRNGFSQVDGVDYVNNEYLENQEFNLDGKKRFYTMPDGTGRLETIERKKGVSRSVLDKLFNRNAYSAAPIVLSTTYARLSSEDLKSAFENDRCFLEGYKKTIKTLTLKNDVGLWPRKPLKEKFEYELVKLDPSIQYMQIDSYSSNNKQPVYYWPLVVFLDEKGCIEEGVSGFKSNKTTETVLQHAALQGVIKVPKDIRYILMTPLASAIDVPEQELSNQGQIKISVLQ